MSARNFTAGTVAGISRTRVLTMVAAAGAAGLVLAGCTPDEPRSDAPYTTPAVVTGDQARPGQEFNDAVSGAHGGAEHGDTVTASLKNKEGADVGVASFTAQGDHVAINLRVTDLDTGLHGVHIHSVGKCEGDFSSAGGHLQVNGRTSKPESGDLASVSVLKDGTGSLNATTDAFTVDQIRGKALVVHEVGDTDGTQRLACGVISAEH